MLRALRNTGYVVLAIATCIFFWSFALYTPPGDERVGSEESRRTSVYIPVDDGVEIAVDIWLPSNAGEEQKFPVLMETTRYWRGVNVGWLGRIGMSFGILEETEIEPAKVKFFNDRGFVYVLADARGTGASGGDRAAESTPRETADMGLVADWLAEQDWSNGSIGTLGVSYAGTSAELSLASGSKSIKAAALLFSDFDVQFGLLQPGGVTNRYLEDWGTAVGHLDRNDVCALQGASGLSCWMLRQVITGVRPVEGKKTLRNLIDDRNNPSIIDGLDGVEHRDDRLGGMEFVFADLSPYGHRAAIEASDTPLFVQTGWYDAFTADGALARYLTFSNPQTIWIGAWAHGGDRDTDPFRHVDSEPRPDPPAQWARIASFFDQTLVRNEVVKESSIEFAILGTDEWRKSETWPPQGVGELTLFLSDVGSLSRTAPPEATDTRAVDFSATMGNRTRIHTNFGRGDVVYENLQAQAERSWVFETNPLDRDIEIVGSASLALEAAIESTSTAFHGYLEAVLQSGEVVYLTEAVARASMSTPTSDPLPYVSAGSFPSFSRSAVRPLTGEKQSFILAFSNVATRVPEGARIRLRLAGADTGIYEPYPDTEEAVWTVHFGEEGSRLILPTFSK